MVNKIGFVERCFVLGAGEEREFGGLIINMEKDIVAVNTSTQFVNARIGQLHTFLPNEEYVCLHGGFVNIFLKARLILFLGAFNKSMQQFDSYSFGETIP